VVAAVGGSCAFSGAVSSLARSGMAGASLKEEQCSTIKKNWHKCNRWIPGPLTGLSTRLRPSAPLYLI